MGAHGDRIFHIEWESRRAVIDYGSWVVGATENDARTEPPQFKRGRSSWEARVRHEAQRLQADLDCTRVVKTTWSAVDNARIKRIDEHLNHADYLLDEHFKRNWPIRLVTASRVYQDALASVYRASEDLILVQSTDAMVARLPGLRAAVKSYLSADDPLREIFLLRIDAVLTSVGAERLAAAARAAEDARQGDGADSQGEGK